MLITLSATQTAVYKVFYLLQPTEDSKGNVALNLCKGTFDKAFLHRKNKLSNILFRSSILAVSLCP